MGRIRKLFAKDKHVIVRGSIVLMLLLLLCAFMFTWMLLNFAQTSVEVRVADASGNFSSEFEQIVRNWFTNLDATAKLLREDPDRETLYLNALYDYNPYDEVGVMSHGTIRHSDGSTADVQYETAYIYSEGGVPRGRFITLTDGSILLCASIDESSEVVARYDPAGVGNLLFNGSAQNYGFAVYNASTGAYLVNRTPFTENGYYDALLALNANGSASGLLNDETTIARLNSGGERIYIAQRRTAIRPWNIALVIPEAEIGTYIAQLNWMPYAVAGAVLLLAATHALFVFFCGRRMREETEYTERSLEASERLLSNLAWEAETTLFIYRRGQEGPMRCYDGLGLLGAASGIKQLITLRALEDACGLDEADVERLHVRMSELDHGSTAVLMLRGALPDREERKLRFELSAYDADKSVIICSVRDRTQELLTQNRAATEQSYLEANAQNTVAVWALNVSRNLWRCVHIKDIAKSSPIGVFSQDNWRDFTADLNGVLREYIHPADYASHVQKMSIQSIAGFYRAGRTEIDLDYRVLAANREDYEWHRMRVHLYSDVATGEILANVYVFDVDVEKKAELERGERKKIVKKALRALSGIYYALYYVDLDNDLCYAAKSHDGEVVTRLCTPYRETFDRYLDSVHPMDRDEMRSMLDVFNMRRNFVEGSRFQRMEYRRQSGDGYRWAAVIIQPARYENGRIKDVVIAMRNLVNHRHDLDLE